MTKKDLYVPRDKQGITMAIKLKENFSTFFKSEAQVNSKEFDIMIENVKKKGVPITLTKNPKKTFETFDY